MESLSLLELEGKLAEREARFRDSVIPASEIRMEPERGDLAIRGEPHPAQDQVLTLLGPKIEVPAQYLRRCPPWLRAENFNHFVKDLGDRDMLVRYDGNDVRAVLSTRYKPVSNLDLVQRLTGFLSGSSEAKVTLTETKMVVQVIHKEHRRLMAVGDEVFGGLHLANSEVGFASVEVAQFLHRMVCTNGLVLRVTGESYRRIHLKGGDTLVEDLREAFTQVVAGLPNTLGAMAGAMAVTLDDPEASLENLPRRYGLTEDEHEAVKTAWATEQGPTLYHLVNSITGAAKSEALSFDSRLRLQTLAGDLLPALS